MIIEKMTVGRIIEKLEKFPKDKNVILKIDVDSCGCAFDHHAKIATDVEADEFGNPVLIADIDQDELQLPIKLGGKT
jgi:hypothetical protein